MSLVLWRKEWKLCWKIWVVFAAVLSMYSIIIIRMFDPAMGESLKLMTESMPELFAAFGMSDPGSTLLEFLVNYLYGFLFVAFPAVFILLMVRRLLLRYIEKGTLAYLLATPESRRTLAATQIITMISALIFLNIYLTILLLGFGEMMFPGELISGEFLWVSFGLLGLWLFLAGICWLTGCMMREPRLALGTGGGICIYVILVKMLADMGGDVEWMKYLTPLTLYDPLGLSERAGTALAGTGILYGAGLSFVLAGIQTFCRRDFSV